MSWEIEEALEQLQQQRIRFNAFLIKEAKAKCHRCLTPLEPEQIKHTLTWQTHCCGEVTTYDEIWTDPNPQ